MFKKVVCFLLLPLCMVCVLAGCGKSKTTSDINTLYVKIKTENKENLFLTKNDVLSNTISVNYNGELSKLLKDGEPNASLKSVDANLYNRYYGLKTVQHKVITNISEYYDIWSKRFYEGIGVDGATDEEFKTLYSKLEKLSEDVKTFETARKKVEADINVMTYSGAIRSNLTEYSYQFNQFIESYSDFINYFRNLQVKGLYDNNVLPEDNPQLKAISVSRLFDEFYLNASEFAYYRILKAYDRVNECDLANAPFENEKYSDYKELIDIVNKTGEYAPLVMTDANSTVGEAIIQKINANDEMLQQFIYARNSFCQKFEIYKKIYDKVDYYTYNQAYVENAANGLEEYKLEVTDIERANLSLLESFEKSVFEEYFKTYSGLLTKLK